ncbi:MAG TPA: IS1595 family transposase [Thermoleophilaceae bacterium]|jgi:transposase-like protein
MTYSRFLELFPDNDACLEYLRGKFFPDGSDCPGCGKPTKFFRIKSRAAYSCMYCRQQVYPTAGTIFHKSTVSLQLWFFAIYLMSSTRCGISAKQLEREIGVTYKTAHRMFKQIRTLLSDDEGQLSGNVEADETAIGGKPRAAQIKRLAEAEGRDLSSAGGTWKQRKKTTVFGMVERGGRVRAQVVSDRKAQTLQGQIVKHVLPGSMIFTDEWPSYLGLEGKSYGHRRVKHAEQVYVSGDLHTQTIEGFWSLFKNGVRGVYHAVSTTYLQDYLNEYAFRYNRRNSREPMFWAMLRRVEQRRLVDRPLGS